MGHRSRHSVRVVALLLLVASTSIAGATPGEVRDVVVDAYDLATGNLTLSYTAACGAADHHIEFGPLDQVATHGYSGQECGIGTGGFYDQFDPGSGSYFFLVVGNDGAGVEGSYGLQLEPGMLSERPEDALDPSCALVQDLTQSCDIPVMDLLAYRPQSESYGSPLQRTAVPDGSEETPGVGFRLNGDDDDNDIVVDAFDPDVAGENDLIEVTLTATPAMPLPGLEYVLRRSDANVAVWDQSSKGSELFGMSDEIEFVFSQPTETIWVESATGAASDVELVARRVFDQSTVAVDALHFYPFSSVVIALGGEGQVPADPPLEPGNHGTFVVAIDLYNEGYDVHMYDEDVVSSSGAGAAYDEVVSAVSERGVSVVAIYGYSHGGGSTNDLARRLDQNRGTIGTFSIDFTGYMDGIDNDSDIDIGTETQYPTSSTYHANYYENPGCGLFALCGGPIAGAAFDLDVNSTAWGASLDHFSVDDHPNVTGGIHDQLVQQVAP